MKLEIPFNVEVKATAKSSLSLELIDARLSQLRLHEPSKKRDEEIDYLLMLRKRECGE